MYVYQADVYCDDCGRAIASSLNHPGYEKPWDTDDYPAHHPDDQEADSPQHCGACGCPIDTVLTDKGAEYVMDAIVRSIEEAVEKGRAQTWDRLMPMKGTAEEGQTYWHGERHIEIVRGWAEMARECVNDKADKDIIDLFISLSRNPNK